MLGKKYICTAKEKFQIIHSMFRVAEITGWKMFCVRLSCALMSFYSLTAPINNSRRVLALCVCVCAHVCVFGCVYVLYILHWGARGLRWSHGTTATTHCPRPPGPLALCSSPGWQPCIRATHHRLCPSPLHPTHTQTNSNSQDSLHPPPPCSGPIDTALRLSSDQSFGGAVLPEENPIQHSLSG